MNVVGNVLLVALQLYVLVLIARIVFDYIQLFARDWQPSGVILIAAEAIYSVTDPPLRLLRRFIPPVRLGQVSLDLSFLVLFIVITFLLIPLASRLALAG